MNIKKLKLTYNRQRHIWQTTEYVNVLHFCHSDLSQFMPLGVLANPQTNRVTLTMSDTPLSGREKSHHGSLHNGWYNWSIYINTIHYRFPKITGINEFLSEWVRENGNLVWFKIERI